ncbi:hypothetical protein CRG98_030662 [Punica granatum]|uniref:Uncharacterized protein n=1 Tax=Punica granatum TaxID=22663 RepID=A0A2I0IY63_PUNGR|nr:hypothetical protein CRG98_030662 [Punica granatum]
MTVVVVCSQSYRVDSYRPAKITENRVRLENRPDWAVFWSDVTVVSSDGILRQGQRLPTPNSPLEVVVVVVFQKESRIDPICKKTAQTARNFDPTGQPAQTDLEGLGIRVGIFDPRRAKTVPILWLLVSIRQVGMEEEDNGRGGHDMDEAAMSVAVGPTGHKGSSDQSSGLD